MSTFFENDPTLQSYWRSIILYGRNVASYKFALGKALIDLNKKPNDLIKLEDLSEPFSNHLCEHLKVNEKQITSSNSKFLNALKKFNEGTLRIDERNDITKKLGFVNVIDAFHVVNSGEVPTRFFYDERSNGMGISISDDLLQLSSTVQFDNLSHEIEVTTIYMSHDQIEAMTLADRVVVMTRGIVQQIGKPMEIYDRPANNFIAGFIGNPAMNLIEGKIENGVFRAQNTEIP